jgi:hypothetical protein
VSLFAELQNMMMNLKTKVEETSPEEILTTRQVYEHCRHQLCIQSGWKALPSEHHPQIPLKHIVALVRRMKEPCDELAANMHAKVHSVIRSYGEELFGSFPRLWSQLELTIDMELRDALNVARERIIESLDREKQNPFTADSAYHDLRVKLTSILSPGRGDNIHDHDHDDDDDDDDDDDSKSEVSHDDDDDQEDENRDDSVAEGSETMFLEGLRQLTKEDDIDEFTVVELMIKMYCFWRVIKRRCLDVIPMMLRSKLAIKPITKTLQVSINRRMFPSEQLDYVASLMTPDASIRNKLDVNNKKIAELEAAYQETASFTQ